MKSRVKTRILFVIASTILLAVAEPRIASGKNDGEEHRQEISPSLPDGYQVPDHLKEIASMPEIEPARPPIRELPTNIWGMFPYILLPFLVILLAFSMGWRRYLSQVGKRTALSEMKELEHSGLLNRGEIFKFYARLNLIIRRFIHRCYHITWREQSSSVLNLFFGIRHKGNAQLSRTNRELLAILQDRGMEKDERQSIREVLEECDRVKFARYRPAIESARATLTKIRRVLESWESEEEAGGTEE